jgi:hypothetical protein
MRRAAKETADELLRLLAPYRQDPAAFVRQELGATPEPWQADVLAEVGTRLKTPDEAIRIAVASGHGVGKSALVAWLLLWALATQEDTRGVVTANTETQLRTKTWAELAKWFRGWERGKACFELAATALASRVAEHAQTWRIDIVPWSPINSEAFAGLHNKGKRVIVVFDEASAIPDVIWETTEGALTDGGTELVWLVFGNPTRNTGRFRECFGRFGHRWRNRQVDSRDVGLTNKEQIARWIEDYGEDSDFVRVRVRGVFPRAGSTQFIPSDLAETAARRAIDAGRPEPAILGVDVARFGDDRSVIYWRRGNDARSTPPLVMRGIDTMTLVGKVTEIAGAQGIRHVFVDEGGLGAGVVDRLRQLSVPGVIGVNFGSKADGWAPEGTGALYANKRAEMWGRLRDWLKTGAIPDDAALVQDLTGVEYGYDAHNAIRLESKDDMKRRGLASPDLGDALALTFAMPVYAPPDDQRGPLRPTFLPSDDDRDIHHDI